MGLLSIVEEEDPWYALKWPSNIPPNSFLAFLRNATQTELCSFDDDVNFRCYCGLALCKLIVSMCAGASWTFGPTIILHGSLYDEPFSLVIGPVQRTRSVCELLVSNINYEAFRLSVIYSPIPVVTKTVPNMSHIVISAQLQFVVKEQCLRDALQHVKTTRAHPQTLVISKCTGTFLLAAW